ncbi:MAG: hypothetical protein A3G18_04910 [Rhodospirillales bacterium RIFCSPLOWO2_12_FULL_58_28]|nr:MAG: hypothetical protein A3H92_03760 [Rhodospirillales bacterium RIFCSPLOWO2_02_FULL_58_16]OHC78254.1 MAG: hypothetical protein A3G18_04910 [Rhodospirillales bacterium RIFCSPLOWO2_12_FULL_58_28]
MILRTTIGAFLYSKETVDAVEAIKGDRLFLRSSFETHEGGVAAAVSHLANHPLPALLIIETKAQGDALYDELNKLAEVCAPDTNVILIGVQNDIRLYRELIVEGIRDYLIAPVDAGQLRNAIENIFKDDDVKKSGRLIGFMGVTGGVGSSVISHNVAYELVQAYEQDVIVIDLDIAFGTAALVYNFQPRQTIIDVLGQAARLDESFLEQFLMEYANKLTVLASPASLSSGVQITVDSVNAIIKYAGMMADFVILDMPHVWDAWVIDVLSGVDDLVLMARPDLGNLRNAKNMLEFISPKRGADAPIRLILNQVGAAKRADLSDKDFKEALAMNPSLSIPYDPEAFGRAVNNGEMMSKASAKSKATEAIIKLAKLISAREADEEGDKKKSGLGGLFKKDKKDKKDKKKK